MQGIGIGISDFKVLRLRNNYFIDKSMYIKDIIDNPSGVVLITRPRRFGKTLNMSMLRYYFNIREKTIEDTLENAKKQIEEKEYEENLKERGFTNITKMVYAFNGKEVKMSVF